LDLGVVERGTHLRDEAEGAPRGLAGCFTALDQFSGLMIPELFEDNGAPHGPVHALDGEREQEVPLQARP
jgi:hypothetical protein